MLFEAHSPAAVSVDYDVADDFPEFAEPHGGYAIVAFKGSEDAEPLGWCQALRREVG